MKKRLTPIAWLLLVFSYLGNSSAQVACNLSTHRFYQQFTVTNGGAALSNYQMRLVVNTSSLVSASKMLSSGADIRFTNSSCTNVEYWIESGMNTASTAIWMKIPSVPNGTSQIYMYYGYSSASAASNSANVFDFIDDFNGSSLNTSNWSQSVSGGSTSVSGGAITLSTTSWNNILTQSSFSSPEICEMNITALSGNWPHIGQFTSASSGDGICLIYSLAYGQVIAGYMPGQTAAYGANFYQYLTPGTLTGLWTISWSGTNSGTFSWPGGSGTFGTTPTKPTNIRGVMGCLNGGTASITVDWYRMRKYAAIVPTFSTGTEYPNYNVDFAYITRTAGSTSNLCGSEFFGAAFNIVGNYSAGLSLVYELSDANGSFSSPTTISNISGSGVFNFVPYYFGTGTFIMSNNLPFGTGYRMRIRSNNPVFIGAQSGTFTIGAKPTGVGYTINNSAQCNENDQFVFTGSSSIAGSNTRAYLWNYGDSTTGSANPATKSYSYFGSKTVKMKVYNTGIAECADSVTKVVVVHPQPVAALDHYDNCQNDDAFFSSWASYVATGWIDQSYYDFGDGNNTTQSGTGYTNHKYSNFGAFNVKLIVTSDKGCKDTMSLTHNVFPQPKASFTNDLACDGHEVVFRNNSTVNASGGSNLTAGSNYWSMGDGGQSSDKNPRYQYAGTGNYYVKLVVYSNRYCSDTASKYVTVNPSPKAKFTYKNTCLSDQLVLTNTSSISSGTMTYKWNLGNGTTSTSQNHSLYYTQPGNYNIKLISTAGTGCTDSTASDVVIYSMPVPQFTATAVCQGGPTQFTNLSSGAVSYLWTFEPAQTSTAPDPAYIFGSPGSRSVKLSATTANACTSEINKIVDVWENPTASFSSSTPTNCLNGNKFTLTNTSGISAGTLSHSWNFGDNTVSSAQNPLKTYDKYGSYVIQLNVVSDKNCKAGSSATVAVNPHPVSDFSFSNSCVAEQVSFSNKSTIPLGLITQTAWAYTDAQSASTKDHTRSFNTAGDYGVTLTSTSDKGCTSQASKTYTAWPKPSIDFSSGDACFGLANPFTNASGVSSGFMASYDWDFGDGGSSAEINPSHLYASPGAYTVTLTGKTDKGCMEIYLSNVSVWPQPKADFSMNHVCLGLPSVFANASTISGGTMAMNWNFGDGQTAIVNNPSHTYTAFGNYLVTLKVSSDKNCEASVSKEAKVYRQPTAIIGASKYQTSVLEPEIIFYDNSQFGDTRIWTFSGGSNGSSILPIEQVSFNLAGTYPVVLVSSSSDKCSDTANATVIIDNAYSIYFPTAFTPNGDKLNEEFGAVGIFNGIKTYTFHVLDNKGRVIFHTTDITKKWNGKLENTGEMLASGPYAWFAEYTDHKNLPHKVNGIISIRR